MFNHVGVVQFLVDHVSLVCLHGIREGELQLFWP